MTDIRHADGSISHKDAQGRWTGKSPRPGAGIALVNPDAALIADTGDDVELDAPSPAIFAVRDLDPESPLLTATEDALVTRPEQISLDELRDHFHYATELKGSDAPTLSVEVGKARFYMNPDEFNAIHPELANLTVGEKKDWCVSHADEARNSGILVPSITSTLGVMDKPGVNMGRSKETAKANASFAASIREKLAAGDVDGAMASLDKALETDRYGNTELEKWSKGAADRKWSGSAERGTNVHSIVEARSVGQQVDVPTEYAGYIAAYDKYVADNPHYEYVATEITVIGDGYMGTTDAVVRDKRDGKLYVVDYKTNDRGMAYDDVGVQLAAAASGNRIAHADGTTDPLPRISGGICLALGPNGQYEAKLHDTDSRSVAFAAVVSIWQDKRNVKTNVTLISRAS